MLKGFRDFLFRGNVIDLAVAVIIGAQFTAIVTALVNNVISPLIGAIVGKPNFDSLILDINGGQIKYGSFLTSVINFLIQAAVVYFIIVLPANYIMNKLKKEPPPADPTSKECPQCLSEIPLAASRCKFCAQSV